jgi:REP element-mobilizing transposase RayT
LFFDASSMKVLRNPLKRFYGRGDIHFVTFSCYHRRPYLGTVRARNRFVQVLRHAFALIGCVVIPEHVHLLIGEPAKANPSKALQVLKQKVSGALRAKSDLSGRQLLFPFVGEAGAPAFWQRRSTTSTFGALRS